MQHRKQSQKDGYGVSKSVTWYNVTFSQNSNVIQYKQQGFLNYRMSYVCHPDFALKLTHTFWLLIWNRWLLNVEEILIAQKWPNAKSVREKKFWHFCATRQLYILLKEANLYLSNTSRKKRFAMEYRLQVTHLKCVECFLKMWALQYYTGFLTRILRIVNENKK